LIMFNKGHENGKMVASLKKVSVINENQHLP